MAIRTALVGCGEHSLGKILPNLVLNPSCEIVAVCDVDKETVEKARQLTSQRARAYTVAADMLRDEEVDAVIVVAPPQIHYAVAHLALSTGRHVFVEKPPTTTARELETLCEQARKQGLVTAVGHNLRHSLAWRQVERIAKNEQLGKLVCVNIGYSASGPRGYRWGLKSVLRSFLLSHVIHAADLAIALAPNLKVLAVKHVELADGGSVLMSLLEGAGNVAVSLAATTCAPTFALNATLVYANGKEIRLKNLRHVEWQATNGEKRVSEVWNPKTLDVGYATAGYAGELAEFFCAIETKTRASPDFEEEQSVYRVLDSIEGLAR